MRWHKREHLSVAGGYQWLGKSQGNSVVVIRDVGWGRRRAEWDALVVGGLWLLSRCGC